MERNFQMIPIYHELRPSFYDEFRCLMANCQLNCCQESWRIPFNKGDYLKLKNLRCSEGLKKKLEHGLRRIKKDDFSLDFYGEFNMQSGACPLFREDGLCALQLEMGEKVQPVVCHSFPRLLAKTPFGYLERSLSPACEGVLELLWNRPEGIDFIAEPLPETERGTSFFQTNTGLSQPDFQEIRSLCVDILQDRRCPLPQRILLMGVALRELVDGETDISRWSERMRAFLFSADAADFLRQFDENDREAMQAKSLLNNAQTLLSIDSNSKDFQAVKREIASALGLPLFSGPKISFGGATGAPLPIYLAAKARFEERYRGREYFMENLIVTVFFNLYMPHLESLEELWKSYVTFCSVCSFYRFMAIMSCREGADGDRAELFRLLVQTTRRVMHDSSRRAALQEGLFQHDSATLAHMAVLLSA